MTFDESAMLEDQVELEISHKNVVEIHQVDHSTSGSMEQ